MKTLSTTLILLLSCLPCISQDIHFSFAERNPLVLNPAFAGANYKKEATLNYRNQWSSLGDPITTTTLGFHSRITAERRNSGNTLAIGIQFTNDKAGNPRITGNTISAIIADHIQLSRESKIGAALKIGYGQRAIRAQEGQWATQFNGTTYDPSIGSGEAFETAEFRYLDVGAGLLYTYKRKGRIFSQSDTRIINAGISGYHLNRPNNSFFTENTDKLPVRWSAFASAEIGITGTNGIILPGVYYHQQGPLNELLIGALYKFKITDDTRYTGFNKPLSVSLGLFGRLRDAGIIKMMLDWDQYSLGYAFDFNASGLSEYSNGFGAHEIFLRFCLPEAGPSRFSR
jgi:type IX secretion system PorP/SprF family membrane protein